MIRQFAFGFALSTTLLAGSLVAVAPASGAQLPGVPPRLASAPTAGLPIYTAADDVAHNHRWRRYHRGPDAGDVLAGALIIGGIAVIADAVRDAERDARRTDQRERWDERYPDPRRDDRPEWRGDDDYPYSRSDRGGDYRSDGLDRAIRICADEVERREPVASVHSARRDVRGWTVEGALERGGEWRCAVGNDGRVETIDTDAGYDQNWESDQKWESDRDDEQGRYDPSARREIRSEKGGSHVASHGVTGTDLPDEMERAGWAEGPGQHDAEVYAAARAAVGRAAPDADALDDDHARATADGRYDLSEVGDFED